MIDGGGNDTVTGYSTGGIGIDIVVGSGSDHFMGLGIALVNA